MSRKNFLRSLFWDASRDRAQNKWMVHLAVVLVMTPMLLLFPVTIQFVLRPLWMFDDWNAFVLFAIFYGAPWFIAGCLAYAAANVGDPVEPGA